MSVLSRLQAPMGTYSIMGNHDYGDYYNWNDHAERVDNEMRLKAMQERMGWRMLNNATRWLRKGNDSIGSDRCGKCRRPSIPYLWRFAQGVS